MILKSFRVTEFRSVKDSGWIDAESITALIGTNESGKTNILLPLWKLNPADEGKIDLKTDLPRDEYHLYRSASPKPVFIQAKYVLSEQEKHDLSTLSGRDCHEFSEIIVSKDFDNTLHYEFPFSVDQEPSIVEKGKKVLTDCHETLESGTDTSNRAETERRDNAIQIVQSCLHTLETNATFDGLKAVNDELEKFSVDVKSSIACVAMSNALQKYQEIISECGKPKLAQTDTITEYICKHMPKYVYYSNYGNLDSQIYLPQVLQNIERTDLGEKDAPKEITDLGTEDAGTLSQNQIDQISDKKKEREILLASASTGFTKSFNEWWKQGNYTFEFQADGNFFRIWVSDSIRPEKIELESRSTGLQWFFSFYLVFLVESELHHQNAILLLDEPGVTLHPLAQKDLFLFFENLAQSNQMLYTTHSPFMVDSNHLERVRAVYIDTDGKTVVSPDLRAAERAKGKNQPQSIYPAHAALGLSVSDTLLVNCNPVLVEGESDQVYLSALKNLLISKGKIAPLKDLVFIPTGGVKGIKATSAILSGASEIKPPVLLDGDKPGIKMSAELQSDFYAAEPQKVISVSDLTTLPNGEIEDLFPKEKLAKIVARFLPRPEEVDEDFDDVVKDDTPICDQIEVFAQNHGISLGQGWKVRLATAVKKEILKGTDKVLSETDTEFSKAIELFGRLN